MAEATLRGAPPRDRFAAGAPSIDLTESAARRVAWPIVLAITLAVVVRAILVFSHDFPLNDGALFLLMTQELWENGLRLPATTSYNGAQIPFAYSPLAFYTAAVLHGVFGVSLVEIFRFLPFVMATLVVGAFALLARELLPRRVSVVAAVFTFAVLPRSYLWLIMGGGLTRSFGFLFAVLSLHQLYRAYTRREQKYVITTTLLCSLTVLSHLGTAPFVAFSAILFFLFFGRHRFGIVASLTIAIGTLALTAPWWATVALTHGFEPFLAASDTGGTIFTQGQRTQVLRKLAYFGLGTAEPLFPLIGALAIFGSVVMIGKRQYLLTAWWLTIILLDVRAGATYSSIPVAMLAGVAITDFVIPSLSPPHLTNGARRRWTVATVLAIFLGYGVASALVRAPHLGAEGRFLTSLTEEDRATMRWVAQNTPRASRFVIVVGGAAGGWWADRIAEWFPVIAQRTSVATVQGTEWLPDSAFARQERRYDSVQGCAVWDARCLEQWERDAGLRYTHVYIPRSYPAECCAPLVAALRADRRYALVHEDRAAWIFARRAGPVPATSGALPYVDP